MFDRIKYKQFAKIQIKNRFAVPALMIILTTFIMILFDIPETGYKLTNIDFSEYLVMSFSEKVQYLGTIPSKPAYDFISVIKMMVSFVFEMAAISVYLKMSRSPDPVSFSDFIEGFSAWRRSILCGLWNSLFIFLWSLLFLIPGIVKAYAYSQMYYLVVEFPDLSIPNAMKLSMQITKGHKWDLFVLDLSFIGWFILSALTCGLASFYVTPYYNMTKLNAFHALLKEAVEEGTVRMEDLHD